MTIDTNNWSSSTQPAARPIIIKTGPDVLIPTKTANNNGHCAAPLPLASAVVLDFPDRPAINGKNNESPHSNSAVNLDKYLKNVQKLTNLFDTKINCEESARLSSTLTSSSRRRRTEFKKGSSTIATSTSLNSLRSRSIDGRMTSSSIDNPLMMTHHNTMINDDDSSKNNGDDSSHRAVVDVPKESRAKFSSVKALFENLERQSRKTSPKFGAKIPKNEDSSNNSIAIAKVSAPPPPIPPKPNILDQNPIRRRNFSLDEDVVLNSPRKEEEISKPPETPVDLTSLDAVADEFAQLVNNLLNFGGKNEQKPEISMVESNSTSNALVTTYSDSASSSSTKVVCNETSLITASAILNVKTTNSIVEVTKGKNYVELEKRPKNMEEVAISKSTPAQVEDQLEFADESADEDVFVTNLDLDDPGLCHQIKTGKKSLSEETLLADESDGARKESTSSPTIDQTVVKLRQKPAPTFLDDSSSENTDRREVRSLSCHVSVPQDFEVDMKRLSTCSDNYLNSEHHTLATCAFDKYVISHGSEIHWVTDNEFYIEIPGLEEVSFSRHDDFSRSSSFNNYNSCDGSSGDENYKPPTKVKFSSGKIRVFSTYCAGEYDRRNEDIDPISASAEYELEKRLENMDILDIDVDKGNEGLGFSIIGMGVGADAGIEKLGIFVKSITPGGAVFRDGRIQVCDLIVEVDGKSLIGVSQSYAANILRSTTGIVRFKVGREHDLDQSEIAQLIRQSLEQDQRSILREQEILAKRLNMSNDTILGNSVQKTCTTNEPAPPSYSKTAPSSASIPESSLSTSADSLNGETPINKNQSSPDHRLIGTQEIDQLIYELRKQEELPLSVETKAQIHSSERAVDVAHASSAFHIQSDSDNSEMAGYSASSPMVHSTKNVNCVQIVNEANQSRDSGLDSNQPSHEKVNTHPFFDSKHYSLDISDDDERVLTRKIDFLETTLGEVKREAEKYQVLLVDSQHHYTDLEKQYEMAKMKIKDYQDRERALVEREEAHLKELREKDAQYNSLIRRLNEKITILEKQLGDAVEKRSSFLENMNSSRSSETGGGETGPTTQKSQTQNHQTGGGRSTVASTVTATVNSSDVSPALAYLPSKKVIEQLQQQQNQQETAATWPKKAAALDKQPRTVSFDDQVPGTSAAKLDSISSCTANNYYGALSSRYGYGHLHHYTLQHQNHDFGVPETDLLDSTAAKSKVEAVRQSLIMSARSLPSRHADSEVFVMCHHTLENAEHLKNHTCHLTETCAAHNNDLPLMEQNGDSQFTTTKNGTALQQTNNSNANNGFGTSPMLTRKLSDLFSGMRSKKQASASGSLGPATTTNHKDLEQTMRGTSDIKNKLSEVLHWNCDDVVNFLIVINMEKYKQDFVRNRIDGCKFLQLDGAKLKALGMTDANDRALIKKRVKEIKSALEKERKKEGKKFMHISSLLDKDKRSLKHCN